MRLEDVDALRSGSWRLLRADDAALHWPTGSPA